MNSQRNYSLAGILMRLTGLQGFGLWLIPDEVALTPQLERARCCTRKRPSDWGMIMRVGDMAAGAFGRFGPAQLLSGRPAPASAVSVLAAHAAPGPVRRLTEITVGHAGDRDELPPGHN